jgi:hypothetical protein
VTDKGSELEAAGSETVTFTGAGRVAFTLVGEAEATGGSGRARGLGVAKRTHSGQKQGHGIADLHAPSIGRMAGNFRASFGRPLGGSNGE